MADVDSLRESAQEVFLFWKMSTPAPRRGQPTECGPASRRPNAGLRAGDRMRAPEQATESGPPSTRPNPGLRAGDRAGHRTGLRAGDRTALRARWGRTFSSVRTSGAPANESKFVNRFFSTARTATNLLSRATRAETRAAACGGLCGSRGRRPCGHRATPSLAARCALGRATSPGRVAHRAAGEPAREREVPGLRERALERASSASAATGRGPHGRDGFPARTGHEQAHEPPRTGARTGLRAVSEPATEPATEPASGEFPNRPPGNHEPASGESPFLSIFGPQAMPKKWFFVD